MNLPQFLKDYGFLVIFVLQIGWFVIAWWFRKSVATKDDVTAAITAAADTAATLDGKITQAVERIDRIELACDDAPDSNDIASLRLEMSHHTGQMREFSAQFTGARDTVNAQFDAIDARLDGADRLVKRVETMVDTLTRHLLDRTR